MSGFDGYDDDVPLVAVGAHSRVDVEDMLRMAIQLAHEAKALPMSSSVKINLRTCWRFWRLASLRFLRK